VPVLVGLAGIAIYMFIPGFVLAMITDYEPYTFDKVFNSPKLCQEYGINDCRSPLDYGYTFEEIAYKSLDGTQLNGWYVPSSRNSSKTIAIIHGRTSNRLKTMKYLALVDSLQLDTAYNIFIPDLRNSGKSAPSKTYMGYKFGEDVLASLLMLKKRYQQDTMALYGFSMGAMAIANVSGRSDLAERVDQEQIVIERIILDSPLSNVKETLSIQSSSVPGAGIFFERAFTLYSREINDFGEKMSLSNLLPQDIPILILQSKDDRLTLYQFLEIEIEHMTEFDLLTVKYFEGPDHVRLYQDKETDSEYTETVRQFFQSEVSK